MNNQNIQYNVFFFLFLDIFTLETSDSIFRVFSYKTELKLFHSFFKTLHIKSKETLLRSSFFFCFLPLPPPDLFLIFFKIIFFLEKKCVSKWHWLCLVETPKSLSVVCVCEFSLTMSRCGWDSLWWWWWRLFYFVTESPKVTKKIHKQFIFLRVDGWSQVCARPPANAIARVCEIYSICRSNCRCHVVPWATLWGHTK